MPSSDQSEQRLFASLRAYGADLDRAIEDPSTALPVAELVPMPDDHLRRRYLLAAAAIIAVVAAGAGLLAARDPDRHPAVRTNPNTVPHPTNKTTPPPPPSTTPSTVTPNGNASAPPLIVTTSDGVLRIGADRETHRIIEGPVAVAVSDTAGGVVFQRGEGDTTLWHLPVGATEPVAIVRANPGEWLELFDITNSGGDAAIVYTLQEASTPQDSSATDTPSDTLRTTSLATRRTRVLATVGGWEWGASSISAGGNRFALETGREVTYHFEFRGTDGTVVRVPGNPYDDKARFPDGECPDDPTCPHGLAIAADGSRFAYMEPLDAHPPKDYGTLIHDYRVVVVDTTTGQDVGTVAVHFPQRDEIDIYVPSLDLVDNTVIVNWTTLNGTTRQPQAPLIADLDSGHVSTISVAGIARAG
jgi:hypothetical protein